jgi:hypothetical protein
LSSTPGNGAISNQEERKMAKKAIKATKKTESSKLEKKAQPLTKTLRYSPFGNKV